MTVNQLARSLVPCLGLRTTHGIQGMRRVTVFKPFTFIATSKMFMCLVQSSTRLCQLQYLSRSSLHRLAGLPCRLFLSGPSVVFEAVDMPCPGQFRFSHIVDYVYDFCLLPDPQHTFSILVCAAASLVCACLVMASPNKYLRQANNDYPNNQWTAKNKERKLFW